jgi:Alpha amylase, catalytic domain
VPQPLATPLIYEINTWVWLESLSRKYNAAINLSNIPPSEWDYISDFGFNTVWLMGVWTRSAAGRAIASNIPDLISAYKAALPDFVPRDVVGSPYCIGNYVVDPHLGGRHGLAAARLALQERGLKLILDFVPNHVAPDHPWIEMHPEFFIRGNPAEQSAHPDWFFESGGQIFAYGRDPYFPPWTDTAQLNAFNPGLRQAAIQTLLDIASQCDGVRCDMAMLLLTDIVGRTWRQLPGTPLPAEYWTDVIGSLRAQFPEFLFIAEAYWDLEYTLQQLGFDFCYDKRLYDRFFHSNSASVRAHLGAGVDYQEKLVRFLENHDEPRAAAISWVRLDVLAVAIATLPGAQLYHDGQLTGRRIKLPVQLGRRPDEPEDKELEALYRRMLAVAKHVCQPGAQWHLSGADEWTDAENLDGLLAWRWEMSGTEFEIVINFSDLPARGTWRNRASGPVHLEPWQALITQVSRRREPQ